MVSYGHLRCGTAEREKEYQRTHVTTHAVALLAQYALNSLSEHGLSLRRVWWKVRIANMAKCLLMIVPVQRF